MIKQFMSKLYNIIAEGFIHDNMLLLEVTFLLLRKQNYSRYQAVFGTGYHIRYKNFTKQKNQCSTDFFCVED